LANNYASLYGSDSTGATEAAYAFTGTVEYDLWKNVMSRVEIRWDHAKDDVFGNTGGKKDSVLLAANIIYKF
jgi:opacity protein-like surface antigen